MSYYRKNHLGSFDWEFLAIAIILLIVLFIVRSCASSTIWNDGICSNCGGHYKFQQAIGHNHYTEYMYTCDKCGHSIEVAQHYPEVDDE
jgi:hypothetical protein